MIPTLLKLLLTINSDSKKQESYGAHNTTEETVIGNLIMVVGWYICLHFVNHVFHLAKASKRVKKACILAPIEESEPLVWKTKSFVCFCTE